ncbi:FAD-dependent oxidoreductase [uncultured Methylobacterium sp.]|jgi:D-amino-acid dehydrogenase|uniref:NAD(P)/FAD-dependent oxidoreductase n=1 Tax=uncultured Methylobacterium sp. TaxID=157278 RepID=UPI00262CE8A8|nr:FAD-dependent oxidoreductase [uncultured Methylobacterium sp.]
MEVAVVGAGIVGLACAFHLQAEGMSVRLIERGGIAEGASFGNAGAFAFSDVLPLASPGILRRAPGWVLDPLGPLAIPPAYLPRIAPWLLRFWRASLPDRYARSLTVQAGLMRLAAAAMERMVAGADLGAHLRRDGNLELYESEAQVRAALPGWAAREREGIAFEHVRGARMAELQPGLSPRFVAGTFTPGWITVADPHRFALALHDAVRAGGGRVERAEVVGLTPAGEGVRIALGDGRSLHADAVVLAAGAWSRALARGLGDRIPLETERGYNTTLAPDAFDLRRQLTFGGHGFVVTPLATGLRVGGAVELGGLGLPPNYARADAMLRKAAAFLPGLRVEGGRRWMGFRPSLPDSLPVIGPSRASERVVYAFGHGHLGLTQSAATGRLVADLIARRAPALALAPFRPDRF